MELTPREVLKRIERTLTKAPKRALYALLSTVIRNPPPRARFRPDEVRRVLLIRTDRVGDMIATLPTVVFLRRILPHARIDILASASNARVAEVCEAVTQVFTYPSSTPGRLAMLRMLRSRRFDVVFACVTNKSTGIGLISSYLTGKHGISATTHRGDKYNWLFHVQSRSAAAEPTALRKFLMVVPEVIECRVGDEDAMPCMTVPSENRANADRFLREHALPAMRYSVVNISVRTARNAWTDEGFVRIMDRLSLLSGLPTVVIATPEDARRAQVLATTSRHAIVVPATPDVLDVAALIQTARMVVSPDTAIVHMCSAFSTPMLGLYCRYSHGTDEWGPTHNPHAVVLTPVIGDTVAAITPKIADEALTELWNRSGGRFAAQG
ncbi:MAG: glycosyltransferase family 9 protein [Candidatus Kapaibacterium sp.]